MRHAKLWSMVRCARYTHTHNIYNLQTFPECTHKESLHAYRTCVRHARSMLCAGRAAKYVLRFYITHVTHVLHLVWAGHTYPDQEDKVS